MAASRFGEEFLLPLVRGGTLKIGAPLGRRGLDGLREGGLDRHMQAEVHAARLAVARELLLEPIPPPLDLEALRLAVAVHDLLFLFHPDAQGALIRDRRLAEVADFAAKLARLPKTLDPDTLVARHTMLHLLPSLGRTDVRVSFWVGRREFHGEEPPRRLTAWPSLRRVREERWRVGCFAEAASHPQGAAVVRGLLDGSPLTDLLHVERLEPPLAIGAHAERLAEPALCRLVAYRYLELGLERIGGALATAVLGELDGRAPGPARFACAFLAHLHLCNLLRGDGGATVDGRGLPVFPGVPVTTDLPLRDCFGLYAALHRARPELAAPLDVRRDPRLARRVDAYAAACAGACGAPRVAELGGLILRTLGGPVALPAAAPI